MTFGELFLLVSGVLNLLPVVGLVLAVVALSGRRDADPTGTPAYAIYLEVVSFIALFVGLVALATVAPSLVRIALPEPGSPDEFPPVPSRGEHIASAVQGGVVAVVALLVLAFHWRRLARLRDESAWIDGPASRTYPAYLYAVCFAAILPFAGGAAMALSGLAKVISPSTFASGEPSSFVRDDGISQLVTGGLLAVVSLLIFVSHWRVGERIRRPLPSVAPAAPSPPATDEGDVSPPPP